MQLGPELSGGDTGSGRSGRAMKLALECWKHGKPESAAAGRTGAVRGKGLGGDAVSEKQQSRHRAHTGRSSLAPRLARRVPLTLYWRSLAHARPQNRNVFAQSLPQAGRARWPSRGLE